MAEEKSLKNIPRKEPWGLRWRSSPGFVTFGAYLYCALSRNRRAKILHLLKSCNAWCVLRLVASVYVELTVSKTGILTDLLVYSLIIPVIPYQLEALGYGGIGAKVSWLLVAFVRLSTSFGLLVPHSFRTVRVIGIVNSPHCPLLRSLP